MELLISVFFLCLGAIVGSYLNVLILRYNTGRSSGGRSSCMSCLRELRWYELVPVFSYLFLRGRCRTCTSKVSTQYPLVEGVSALLFLFAYLAGLSPIETSVLFLVNTLFLFIVVYDLRHLIIPRGPMYALLVISVFVLFYTGEESLLGFPGWLNISMGPLLFSFFAAIYVLSGGRAVGFGDAKLALAIGMLLGFPGALSAGMLAFWIGAAVGIVLLLHSALDRRHYASRMHMGKGAKEEEGSRVYFSYVPSSGWHGKSEIPFAPFLALGAFLVYYLHVSVFPLF